MQLRRRDRMISDFGDIVAVLEACLIGRLGFVTADGPYVVPVNFGYLVTGSTPTGDGQRVTVYVHGATVGRKLAAIDADPRCCFETDRLLGLVDPGTIACDLSSYYESVIGFGQARIVTDPDEARAGMRALVARQAPHFVETTPAPPPDKVTVIAIDLDTITGKAHLAGDAVE